MANVFDGVQEDNGVCLRQIRRSFARETAFQGSRSRFAAAAGLLLLENYAAAFVYIGAHRGCGDVLNGFERATNKEGRSRVRLYVRVWPS